MLFLEILAAIILAPFVYYLLFLAGAGTFFMAKLNPRGLVLLIGAAIFVGICIFGLLE